MLPVLIITALNNIDTVRQAILLLINKHEIIIRFHKHCSANRRSLGLTLGQKGEEQRERRLYRRRSPSVGSLRSRDRDSYLGLYSGSSQGARSPAGAGY